MGLSSAPFFDGLCNLLDLVEPRTARLAIVAVRRAREIKREST